MNIRIWLRREIFIANWQYSDKKLIRKYLKGKVGISFNNELGIWVYAIYPINKPELWLKSFQHKKGSLAFIERLGLDLHE